MQLDIFEDSRDVMLRNDVLAALTLRDAAAAGAAWHQLADEYPADHGLAPLAILIEALEGDAAAPPDHAALRSARLALAERFEPAAQAMFGAQAAGWLEPLWRELAQRAGPLAFEPEHAEEHAAPLWLHVGDAAAAIEAVSGIASWRRIPAPLGWMAEARWLGHGLEAAWPLLAELAWLAPARFDALCRHQADPVLDRLRRSFDAEFEGDGRSADAAWFPAWVLTETPALSRRLAEARSGLHSEPEQAMRLILELLGLEHQGRHHDIVERRKRLRGLQPSLYAAYMKTR